MIGRVLVAILVLATLCPSVHAADPQPPIAKFTLTVDGLIATVDATASSDPDGSIVSYAWTWGDGSPDGEGPTAAHAYPARGVYMLRLTVTDDSGLTGTAAQRVSTIRPPSGTSTPADEPPVARFSTVVADRNVSVDASNSTDAEGPIASYSWDWGDGAANASGVSSAHAYVSPGNYTITLVVTDGHGATGAATRSVQIAAPASQPQQQEPPVNDTAPASERVSPHADFTLEIHELSVAANASRSSAAPNGSIVSYRWWWDDGSQDDGAIAAHTFTAAGTYAIELTVVDDRGALATATQRVTVAPASSASDPPPPTPSDTSTNEQPTPPANRTPVSTTPTPTDTSPAPPSPTADKGIADGADGPSAGGEPLRPASVDPTPDAGRRIPGAAPLALLGAAVLAAATLRRR